MPTTVFRAQYALDVQPFVSTEETRNYLCGFCIDPRPAGGVLIVATDGHRMGVFRDEQGRTIGDVPETIWKLPKEALSACKYKRREDGMASRWCVFQTEDPDTRNWRLSIVVAADADDALACVENSVFSQIAGQFLLQPIVGLFPDYRRIVPTQFDADPGKPMPRPAYNAKYLADFAKVGTEVRLIYSDESGPALVRVGGRDEPDDFFGVLMPVRGDGDNTVPDWFTTPAEETS